MQAIQVTQYQTTDGKVFTEESEATQHQVRLDIRPTLDAYLDARELTARARARVERDLLDFQTFVAETTAH